MRGYSRKAAYRTSASTAIGARPSDRRQFDVRIGTFPRVWWVQDAAGTRSSPRHPVLTVSRGLGGRVPVGVELSQLRVEVRVREQGLRQRVEQIIDAGSERIIDLFYA